MAQGLHNIRKNCGATGIGYALLIGLISVLAVVAISSTGQSASDLFYNTGNVLANAGETIADPAPSASASASPSASPSPSPQPPQLTGNITNDAGIIGANESGFAIANLSGSFTDPDSENLTPVCTNISPGLSVNCTDFASLAATTSGATPDEVLSFDLAASDGVLTSASAISVFMLVEDMSVTLVGTSNASETGMEPSLPGFPILSTATVQVTGINIPVGFSFTGNDAGQSTLDVCSDSGCSSVLGSYTSGCSDCIPAGSHIRLSQNTPQYGLKSQVAEIAIGSTGETFSLTSTTGVYLPVSNVTFEDAGGIEDNALSRAGDCWNDEQHFYNPSGNHPGLGNRTPMARGDSTEYGCFVYFRAFFPSALSGGSVTANFHSLEYQLDHADECVELFVGDASLSQVLLHCGESPATGTAVRNHSETFSASGYVRLRARVRGRNGRIVQNGDRYGLDNITISIN